MIFRNTQLVFEKVLKNNFNFSVEGNVCIILTPKGEISMLPPLLAFFAEFYKLFSLKTLIRIKNGSSWDKSECVQYNNVQHTYCIYTFIFPESECDNPNLNGPVGNSLLSHWASPPLPIYLLWKTVLECAKIGNEC